MGGGGGVDQYFAGLIRQILFCERGSRGKYLAQGGTHDLDMYWTRRRGLGDGAKGDAGSLGW